MANPSASGQVAQGTPSAVGSYQFDQDGRLTHLQWANNPHGALNRRHRPKRRPHLLPEKDDTIDRVAAHKEEIVVDMIQAIYSLRTAHDKTDAEGRTLFLFGGPDSIPPGGRRSYLSLPVRPSPVSVPVWIQWSPECGPVP
jgi:hypothetical protein